MNNKYKESAERAVPASRKFNTRKYFFNALLTLISTQISKLMLVIKPTFKVMLFTIFLARSATPTNGSTDRLSRACRIKQFHQFFSEPKESSVILEKKLIE